MRRTFGAASCVDRRARFAARELGRTRSVGLYGLREGGLLAHVRHPLLDMWVLEEIFRFGVYEPPEPVLRALDALQRPVRILDLGGHVGYFGLFMLGHFSDATIVSFEPDPQNVRLLRRTIAINGLESRWEVVEACAAGSDGRAGFISSFHLSSTSSRAEGTLQQFQEGLAATFPFLRGTELLVAHHVEVERRDVFPSLQRADLIKVDIEGSEWEILGDPRLQEIAAPALVLEYHPAYGKSPDADTAVRLALTAAGYELGPSIRGVDAGTIWAWKPGLLT
jgi:FkbM family methyltransferase